MTTTTITVHQSKFGYHPCDLETCKKLKKAHLLLFRAYKEIKAYVRWQNKRNGNGGDGEEPKHPGFMVKKRYYMTSYHKNHRMKYGITMVEAPFKGSSYHRNHPPYYITVLEQYRIARKPAEKPELVPALRLPDNLDDIIEKLEVYYNQ